MSVQFRSSLIANIAWVGCLPVSVMSWKLEKERERERERETERDGETERERESTMVHASRFKVPNKKRIHTAAAGDQLSILCRALIVKY